MGVERAVRFPGGAVPGWPAVAEKLADTGEAPVLRMIDGLPALPDDLPPDEWSELRVGLAGGMVTIRRVGAEVRCVVWGNADPALTRAWNRCCWAVAAAGGGVVVVDGTGSTADEFRQTLAAGFD